MENRRHLTALLFSYTSDLIGLETLLDKIEALYQTEPKVPLNVRISNFKREVFAWNYKNKNKYSNDLLEAFFWCWARVDNNGNLNFENQHTFKIGGRLATFAKLNKQFTKTAQINRLKMNLGGINPLN